MSHRWKIFLAVAVVMVVLTGIWVMTMQWTADSDVDVYRKSLIAKGEKLEIAEVMPAPVPPEQNGVEVLEEAFRLFTPAGQETSNWPPAMCMIAPGKAMVCFEQPDVRGYDSTNSWSNIMDVVVADRPATELLKQAMKYPAIDFELDYKKGFDLLLPHLAPLKRCVIRLSAEAMCDLHEGDTAPATTNLCTALTLINTWGDENFLISQLVRIAMSSIAVNASWELLQSTNVNDAELAMLQSNWERTEFVHPMENAILMERACREAAIKKMRESNEYFNHMAEGGSSGTRGSLDLLDNAKRVSAKFMWHVSWTYSDELRMLQDDETVLETTRTIETNGFFNPAYSNMVNQFGINAPDEDVWPMAIDPPDLHQMFSESVKTDARTIGNAMLAETARRIVITAIALKRYQLKHGGYPKNLDALFPEFLTAVPLDPVDGQYLRYRQNSKGTYLLYSIGENSKDDGGNPALGPGVTATTLYWLSPHALDWVWPQPATKAEIEYFYAHQPK